MLENTSEEIQTRIEKLKTEHRDLDDVLNRLSEDLNVDELQIRRMKKTQTAAQGHNNDAGKPVDA